MPMNQPSFTTNEHRIDRLQYNYDDGLMRESLSTSERERLDLNCLYVSDQKLKFLFQNAMESYSNDIKNKKITEFNATHVATDAEVAAAAAQRTSRFRFL